MYAQAQKVIRKFGGARRLAKAIGREPSSVYKWTYPPERDGTNGLIPNASLSEILKAAERLGITLSSEDLKP